MSDFESQVPVLDLKMLGTLRELGSRTGKDVLGEVASLFLSRKSHHLEDLHGALDASDALRLEHGAHSLKGSSANLGAPRLSQLAAKLEALARQGDLDACAVKLAELEPAFEEVESELRQVLAAPETAFQDS